MTAPKNDYNKREIWALCPTEGNSIEIMVLFGRILGNKDYPLEKGTALWH